MSDLIQKKGDHIYKLYKKKKSGTSSGNTSSLVVAYT